MDTDKKWNEKCEILTEWAKLIQSHPFPRENDRNWGISR